MPSIVDAQWIFANEWNRLLTDLWNFTTCFLPGAVYSTDSRINLCNTPSYFLQRILFKSELTTYSSLNTSFCLVLSCIQRCLPSLGRVFLLSPWWLRKLFHLFNCCPCPSFAILIDSFFPVCHPTFCIYFGTLCVIMLRFNKFHKNDKWENKKCVNKSRFQFYVWAKLGTVGMYDNVHIYSSGTAQQWL